MCCTWKWIWPERRDLPFQVQSLFVSKQISSSKQSIIPVLSLLIKCKDFYFSLCCLSFYWTVSVDWQQGQRPGLLDELYKFLWCFHSLLAWFSSIFITGIWNAFSRGTNNSNRLDFNFEVGSGITKFALHSFGWRRELNCVSIWRNCMKNAVFPL